MRNQSNRRTVLLVTDQPTAATANTAEGLGAESILLGELTAGHLKSDPCLVFDIDPRQVSNVRRLKSALVSRGQSCRIFLVDTQNRVTSVHDNVLGSNRLLPRQASAAEMRAALECHFGKSSLPGDHATTAQLESIEVGVVTLAGSFEAMSSNHWLDNEGVISAGEQIADAICVTSVSDWLAAARSHHDGTYQHCMLATGIASGFATKTGMSRNDIVRVTIAGLLH
ncbi:MAG: hypothetical protein MO852_16595, partial [Candidatus Devosia euplotis]|nr:hypothetical protein [Candidatus Devosia euplotis]